MAWRSDPTIPNPHQPSLQAQSQSQAQHSRYHHLASILTHWLYLTPLSFATSFLLLSGDPLRFFTFSISAQSFLLLLITLIGSFYSLVIQLFLSCINMSFHITTLFALTLILCLTSTPRHPIHPPSKGDGPYTVAEWDMGSFLEPPPEVNFHMHFWIPITNSTLHPKKDTGFGVLIFQSAFAGNVPVELYDTMFARISSNGFIVVGLDRLQGIDATREAGDLHEVIQYLNDNFNAKIREQGYSTIADMSNLLLGSHSAAGHVITAYISKYGCGNVKAMMMMDPVDGYDPWGIVPDYIITPGNMVNFTTPLLHIDNGYDPRTMGMFPACSPAFMSNDRFYNAWNGPKWQINGTRYGHGDILDGDYAEIAGMMCDRDTTLTQDELQIWRTTCGDAITSFFNAVINHEIDELDYIESEKYIAVESVLKHEYNGYSRQDVAGGFCFHEGDDVTVKAKQVHKHKKHHHHQHDKKH